MVIYDLWQADDGFSLQGEELHGDVADWPSPRTDKSLTIRLEELTHFDVATRIEARTRNLVRIQKAKERPDINHMEVHYTCCLDRKQRNAIEDLFSCDQRKWISFTMHGINGVTDIYSRPAPLEDMTSFFLALRSVEILNLHSCPWVRGHGLDAILKNIPFYTNLRELRLQGWQLDRISIDSLAFALNDLTASKISLLSLRSCIFFGEGSFEGVLDIITEAKHLNTLNLSYCNLPDVGIVTLIRNIRSHGSLQCLHIGGNDCLSAASVQAVADWVASDGCRLIDLNLRALWVSYSDDGLLRRPVDFSYLYKSLSKNRSLQRLSLSENYIEDSDMSHLLDALSKKKSLSHLDIGDNPFSERGANLLLNFAQQCKSVESIRFENLYIPYLCTDAIKFQSQVNYFNNRLKSSSIPVPLALWANIVPSLNDGQVDSTYSYDVSTDLIYHFLQTTSGKNGLTLSFRIATEARSGKHRIE